MDEQDTQIGGAQRRFESTQWSKILSFQAGDGDARREVLESLIRRYWKPVYTYIRLQWRRTNEDSKDLAQQFFASLIEGDLLDQVRRERGRFRSFLRVALRNFVADDAKARKTLKRGGDHLVSVEALEEADRELSASEGDPAELMDREWKRVLVSEALDRLRAQYRGRNQETHYQVFEDHYLRPAEERTQEAIAARHNLGFVEVKNILTDGRSRFRQIVHDLISETVTDEEGLLAEIRELWGRGGLP